METGCPGDGSSFPPAVPGLAVLVLLAQGQEEGQVKPALPLPAPLQRGSATTPARPSTPGNVGHTVLWVIRWVLSLETIFPSLVAVHEPMQFVKSNANPNSEPMRLTGV